VACLVSRSGMPLRILDVFRFLLTKMDGKNYTKKQLIDLEEKGWKSRKKHGKNHRAGQGRGFVYSGSEIYGGLRIHGLRPLGVELKITQARLWKIRQQSPYNVGLTVRFG
jgi:hypothetical protein